LILQPSIVKQWISFLVVAPKVVPNKYRNNAKWKAKRKASYVAYVAAIYSLSIVDRDIVSLSCCLALQYTAPEIGFVGCIYVLHLEHFSLLAGMLVRLSQEYSLAFAIDNEREKNSGNRLG
jgi:hypothetical protein